MTMIFFFLSTLALAAPCEPATVVNELGEVVGSMGDGSALLEVDSWEEEEEWEAEEPWALPGGELTDQDILDALAHLRKEGGSLSTVFGMLGDGTPRTLDGQVVRNLIEQSGAQLGILPLESLVKVVSDGKSMEFKFDFNGRSSYEVRTPRVRMWVLRNGRPRRESAGGDRIEVQDRVRFELSPNGITGVREGDLKGRWAFFSVNVGLETARDPGRVATLDGNPVLVTDDNDRPVERNGVYQSATFDDWVVVSTGDGESDKTWVGIPPLF